MGARKGSKAVAREGRIMHSVCLQGSSKGRAHFCKERELEDALHLFVMLSTYSCFLS